MPDSTINGLTALTGANVDNIADQFPIWQNSASTTKKITRAELLTGIPLGTAAAPAISFTGDSNTGIYSPAADTLGLVTGGVQGFQLNSTQQVFVGPDASSGSFTIPTGTGATAAVTLGASRTSGFCAIGARVNDGARIHRAGIFVDDTNSAWGISSTYSTTAWPFVINDGGVERLRIDSSGRVGIGTTSPSTYGYPLNVVGPNSFGHLVLASNDAGGGADIGATLAFGGNDGVTTSRAYATILGRKENSTSGNYASYLSFATRANGGSLTEQMRINSSGQVGIGTTSPSARLQVTNNGSIYQIRTTNNSTANDARSAVLFANDTGDAGYIGAHGSSTGGGIGFPNATVLQGFLSTGVSIIASNASGIISFYTGSTSSANRRILVPAAGGVVIGNGSTALAATATDGFLYVPTCAGAPTGTPTTQTGTAPIVIDSTNNKLYFYSGGAWRDAGP